MWVSDCCCSLYSTITHLGDQPRWFQYKTQVDSHSFCLISLPLFFTHIHKPGRAVSASCAAVAPCRHHISNKYCNTLRHTTTRRNALHCTARHFNTLQYTAAHCNTLQLAAAHCDALQRTATCCSTLRQRTATYCSTL